MLYTFETLPVGVTVTIKAYKNTNTTFPRLLEIGLVPGASVRILHANTPDLVVIEIDGECQFAFSRKNIDLFYLETYI
jgi:Fe2+ transport system protein FeoA